MCGISGILSTAFSTSHLPSARAMVDSMKHRGPDAQDCRQLSQSPSIVFGHDRLAIIDLSEEASQPMTDSDTGTVIVFNGEIYNFKSLRKELTASGQSFRTHSDTEVILKAYAQWGVGCLSRFRGIFAFALWDQRQGHCLLARDPIGVKPLYVYQQGTELRFASEVRALLASGIPRELDSDGLLSAMSYGSLQEPFTLVKNVRSLPPGHFMIWQDGTTTTTPFWSFLQDGSSDTPAEQRIQDLSAELNKALKMQLVSDVPLGAFLSGGIDSTAIVAMLHHSRPDVTLHTLALGFGSENKDERAYAKLAAVHNKTCHKELLIEQKDIRKFIRRALDDVDEPSYDGLNTWFVSKLAKESGLTVALSGLGGDELFAGYNQFQTPHRMAHAMKWLRLLPHSLGQLLANHASSEKWLKMLSAMGTAEEPYFLSRQIFSAMTCGRLLGRVGDPALSEWKRTAFPSPSDIPFQHDDINRYSFLEMTTYLRSTLLRDADQMSMAHSLEIRVPIIDPIVVAKALQVPGPEKLSPAIAKPLLVQAAQGGIPDECLHRPKQGFDIPFQSFFESNFKKALNDFFFGQSSVLFDHDVLSQLGSLYKNRRLSWSRIWTLYSLDYFCKKHGLTA